MLIEVYLHDEHPYNPFFLFYEAQKLNTNIIGVEVATCVLTDYGSCFHFKVGFFTS